jgi:hypothetical protein
MNNRSSSSLVSPSILPSKVYNNTGVIVFFLLANLSSYCVATMEVTTATIRLR